MSKIEFILIWQCLIAVGVYGSNITLSCPQGYLVEGMRSYYRRFEFDDNINAILAVL